MTEHRRFSFIFRTIALNILIAFLSTSVLSPAHAQVLNLPVPGTLVLPSTGFSPVIIKGLNIHPNDPLKLDFIIDRGDTDFSDEEFKVESSKLIKYFMAALTVSEKKMWVNLSPYEANRIIPDGFGETELGRDLLAQDYMLKQFSSSLMHPDESVGEEFWNRVYNRAQEKYGTTDIPMNTFNKIWIVPETAHVYEHERGAMVVTSHLKVMLEEDYVALEANKTNDQHGLGSMEREDIEIVSGVTSDIVREILIPEIEKEVNQGEIFANLRQIYNAVILASWYKDALKGSYLDQVYINQEKTVGVDYADKETNKQIYEQYVESFKVGAYDFIREDIDQTTGEVIPRKYFSGGLGINEIDAIKTYTMKKGAIDPALLGSEGVEKVAIKLEQAMGADEAMMNDGNIKMLLLALERKGYIGEMNQRFDVLDRISKIESSNLKKEVINHWKSYHNQGVEAVNSKWIYETKKNVGDLILNILNSEELEEREMERAVYMALYMAQAYEPFTNLEFLISYAKKAIELDYNEHISEKLEYFVRSGRNQTGLRVSVSLLTKLLKKRGSPSDALDVLRSFEENIKEHEDSELLSYRIPLNELEKFVSETDSLGIITAIFKFLLAYLDELTRTRVQEILTNVKYAANETVIKFINSVKSRRGSNVYDNEKINILLNPSLLEKISEKFIFSKNLVEDVLQGIQKKDSPMLSETLLLWILSEKSVPQAFKELTDRELNIRDLMTEMLENENAQEPVIGEVIVPFGLEKFYDHMHKDPVGAIFKIIQKNGKKIVDGTIVKHPFSSKFSVIGLENGIKKLRIGEKNWGEVWPKITLEDNTSFQIGNYSKNHASGAVITTHASTEEERLVLQGNILQALEEMLENDSAILVLDLGVDAAMSSIKISEKLKELLQGKLGLTDAMLPFYTSMILGKNTRELKELAKAIGAKYLFFHYHKHSTPVYFSLN